MSLLSTLSKRIPLYGGYIPTVSSRICSAHSFDVTGKEKILESRESFGYIIVSRSSPKPTQAQAGELRRTVQVQSNPAIVLFFQSFSKTRASLQTWCDDAGNIFALGVGHKAEHAEDDEATEETGQTVDEGHHDGISARRQERTKRGEICAETCLPINPSIPKFKKFIPPTLKQKMYKWGSGNW